jgi:hypothetical protein
MTADLNSSIEPLEAAEPALSVERNEVNQTLQSTPKPSAAKQFVRVAGPSEPFREGNSYDHRKVILDVEVGYESSVEDILERIRTMSWPTRGIPFPSRPESYGTTGELFTLIKTTIIECTLLSDQVSELLTYWALSTWFTDCLSLAPCLVITGSPNEGDLVLRTLRAFCRRPFLMAGVSNATLKGIDWDPRPTLLISEPNLAKRVGTLLDCSTRMGYMVGRAGEYRDYFGSKAIYLGEDLPIHSIPRFAVHINAASTPKRGPAYPRHLTDSITRSFQNRLVSYRLKSMVKVHNSDFDAVALSSDTRAIANALGACIVDAPDLQTELLSLLAPRAELLSGDRAESLEALAVEATLSLCHQGKTQMLVREIADEANRIHRSRGEKLQFSAEKVGHKLKKVGLYTRRLSSAGNGLLIDSSTRVLVHEVAAAYLGTGYGQENENVDCSLCNEKKDAM